MPVGYGHAIQALERRRDRVLAVARLVASRQNDRRFSPGEVAETFDGLRVPRPGNISQELARLRVEELVVNRREGGWSLTPFGDDFVGRLIGEIEPAVLSAELATEGTANLAGAQHALIPPELAPSAFLPAVLRLLDVSPFERNVFCMTRFPSPDADPSVDPLGSVIGAVREALAEHGLLLHLASDRQADDVLFGNVAAHLWGCKYGIAILESFDPATTQLNDNVLIEVGAMLVSGRRCGLLKDQDAPQMPTDFVAQIYQELDLRDSEQVRGAAAGWAGSVGL